MRYFLFDHSTRSFVAKLNGNLFHSRGSEPLELLGSTTPDGISGERLKALLHVVNHGSQSVSPVDPYCLKEETVRKWLPSFENLRFEGTIYIASSTDTNGQLTLHSVWSKD